MNSAVSKIDLIAEQTTDLYSRWTRLKQWTFRLAEYGLVQGLVQLLTAAAGLLIVRKMSKADYALFAIGNSMQTACNLLADLGIGIGVRSIGGRICDDPFRFGQLLNTALGLRRRFAILSLSFCIPISLWMLWRNGAGLGNTLGLSAVVAVGLFPLLASSVFSVSTQLHGEYRRMQKIDFGNAALRLALVGILAVSRMTAILAASVGVVSNWVQAFFLKHWARNRADLTAPPNDDDRHELQRLSMHCLPNTLFFCFQGQVTLLILTLFGNRIEIAEISAIGRIATLFTIFSVVFTNVLAPRFARCQESARLLKLYLTLVFGSVMVLAPLAVLAWVYPAPLLYLLGAKYGGLRSECFWVVAAGCVAQIAGVMWTLNSSKAWIRVQVVGYIPIILTMQAIAAVFLDLHQFHDVLIFNLVTSAAPIPMFLLDACVGFLKERVKANLGS
jgi:hypothetical protein